MSREELAERLGQIGGCGNAHCIVYEPPGQHTNGGCKCNRDPMRMTQTVWAYKQALAGAAAREDGLQAEVEALKGLLEDALINHLGIMKFSALKKNGWVWPNDAPETVSILSEKIRAALKGAPHE